MMSKENFSRRQKPTRQERFTDSISAWVGSWSFFNIHIVWFGVWLIVNADINLLTLLVSLEAIILMLLLLMQQNRQVDRDNVRDDADYRADMRTLAIARENHKMIEEIKKEIKELKHSIGHDKKNS